MQIQIKPNVLKTGPEGEIQSNLVQSPALFQLNHE